MMIFCKDKGYVIGRTHRQSITSRVVWEFWNKGGDWTEEGGKVFKTLEKAKKKLEKLRKEERDVALHDDGINRSSSAPTD